MGTGISGFSFDLAHSNNFLVRLWRRIKHFFRGCDHANQFGLFWIAEGGHVFVKTYCSICHKEKIEKCSNDKN